MPNGESKHIIPIAFKFALATGLTVAAAVLAAGALMMQREWVGFLRLSAQRAEALAAAGSQSLDAAEQTRLLRSPNPLESSQQARSGQALGNLRALTGGFSHLTTFVPVGPGYAMVAGSTSEEYSPGMLLPMPFAARRLADLEGQVLLHSSIESEVHSNGAFSCVSAYAPLAGPDGKLGAVLAVDVPVGALLGAFEAKRASLLIATLFAGLLGVLLAGFVGSMVAGPVGELVATVRRAAKGDLEHPASFSGRDEIGLLGEACERTRLALKKRIESLEKENLDLRRRVEGDAADSPPCESEKGAEAEDAGPDGESRAR